MSKFSAYITIEYDIDDCDDVELLLPPGVTLASLTSLEVDAARQELVRSSYAKAAPVCFIIEISEDCEDALSAPSSAAHKEDTATPVTRLPGWLDEYMPFHGECGLCGGPDARHRVTDAAVSRIRAGESLASVALDFGLPTDCVTRLLSLYEN